MFGRLIPASVDRYSSVPRVLSEGGRVATRCAKCELDNALKMLSKARDMFDPDLGRGEYVDMSFRIEDAYLCFVKPHNLSAVRSEQWCVSLTYQVIWLDCGM
ncbi:hypothetical protein FGRMN_8955 [Fusarium graminum]|nr:hypothetical protein FGRMN_8955 [Fusarium graminum]